MDPIHLAQCLASFRFRSRMTHDSDQIDPSDHPISSTEGSLPDNAHPDSSANLSLRVQHLERRIQHLEKVIQRQIRLGRMVE